MNHHSRRVLLAAAGFLIAGSVALRILICPPTVSPMSAVPVDRIRSEMVKLIGENTLFGESTPASLTEYGVTSIVVRAFDPAARVVIDVGSDGAFGARGIDDGNNGIVDDRSELGATGSDDTFEIVDESFGMPDSETASVIARGGFVPVSGSAASHRGSASPIDQVIVVGRGFEFLMRRGTDF